MDSPPDACAEYADDSQLRGRIERSFGGRENSCESGLRKGI